MRYHLIVVTLASLAMLAPALAADQGDARTGRKLFRQCKTCHSFNPEKGGFGPHLVGIIGRPAASVEGFPYSDALKASGIVWDEAHLQRWLAGPKAYLPGSAMNFKGLPNSQDRADVIAYLKKRAAKQ